MLTIPPPTIVQLMQQHVLGMLLQQLILKQLQNVLLDIIWIQMVHVQHVVLLLLVMLVLAI
jgi:hypothetical protein